MTQIEKYHCVVISHVFDHMTTEYAAKKRWVLLKVFASFITINGKALRFARGDCFRRTINPHCLYTARRKEFEENAPTATNIQYWIASVKKSYKALLNPAHQIFAAAEFV
ncbi:MAG TPA: hypothetical protein VGP89_10335 [Candidatus Angelobacter sp.]|nr:hypothetical protein [Candidatus Angelobacter sp.]